MIHSEACVCCLRRFAPCGCSDLRGERVPTSEARRRDTPGAEDPRGRPLLQDAANPHGNSDGHRAAAAGGGEVRSSPRYLRFPQSDSETHFSPSHSWTSTSTPRTSASTHSDPVAPAARASTRRTAQCASSTSQLVKLVSTSQAAPVCLHILIRFHGYLFRRDGRVSADPLAAAEPRHGHARAEGQALPEHDG